MNSFDVFVIKGFTVYRSDISDLFVSFVLVQLVTKDTTLRKRNHEIKIEIFFTVVSEVLSFVDNSERQQKGIVFQK